MKILFILASIILSIFAQEYERGTIDTHGGKSESYNNLNANKTTNFRYNTNNLSNFLDSNTSKKFNKKKKN